ncbi:MAG: flagellar basal-body rod protein FlgF [Kiloniellales bacterium]|nr:flagellar basal-body rod protein FlgF [Kiloniellales bacterium]
MDNPGYVALSRQVTLRRQMEMIANNLANMNTTAYRGEQLLFREFLAGRGDGREAVSFVRDPAQLRDLSIGPMASTGAALDVAIDGPGYFVIDTPQGPRYTRDGHFKLDPQGQVTTAAGDPVLAGGGPVVVPIDATDIQIAADGTVSTEQGELGRLDVVTFDDEQLLQRVKGNAYDAGEATAVAAVGAEVVQGMLEASNVQGVGEMTRMIDTLRSYQAAQRLSEQEHERQRRAIQSLIKNN